MDLLRFILRLPFTLVKGVCRLLGGALSLLGRLLRPLVGNFSWRAPAWWAALPRGFLRLESGVDKHPKASGLGLLLLAGAAGSAFTAGTGGKTGLSLSNLHRWWFRRLAHRLPTPSR